MTTGGYEEDTEGMKTTRAHQDKRRTGTGRQVGKKKTTGGPIGLTAAAKDNSRTTASATRARQEVGDQVQEENSRTTQGQKEDKNRTVDIRTTAGQGGHWSRRKGRCW